MINYSVQSVNSYEIDTESDLLYILYNTPNTLPSFKLVVDALRQKSKLFNELFWNSATAKSKLQTLYDKAKKVERADFNDDDLIAKAPKTRKLRTEKSGLVLESEFANLPFYWKWAWTLYLHVLKLSLTQQQYSTYRAIIRRLKFGVWSDDYTKRLKAIGTWAKKARPFYDEDVIQCLIDVHTMGGYTTEFSEDSIWEEVVEWTSKKEPKTWNGSVTGYQKAFREEARTNMEEGMSNTVVATPVYDWIADTANWALTGTTDLARVGVVVDGVVQKAMKNKISASLALSTEELMDIFENDVTTKYTVYVKKESSKARPVIVATTACYLRQAWFGNLVYAAYKGSPQSTSYMSTAQQFGYWSERCTSGVSEGVNFPSDYANFDRQIEKVEIQILIEEWTYKLTKLVQPTMANEVVRVSNLILRDLWADSRVFYDNRSTPYDNGLLSGWFLTSLIGNTANRTWAMLADRFSPVKPRVSFRITMGDDLDQSMRDLASAVFWFQTMLDLSINLHPDKTLATAAVLGNNMSTEYLRKSVTKNKVRGYPARAILTITWGNPNNNMVSTDTLQSVALSEISQGWELLSSRLGMKISNVLDLMLTDMHYATKLSKSILKSVLSTPVALGGLGLSKETVNKGKFTRLQLITQDTFQKVSFVTPNAGYLEIAKYWSRLGVPDNETSRVLAGRLQLKDKVPWHASLSTTKIPIEVRPKWTAGAQVEITKPKRKKLVHADIYDDAIRWMIEEKKYELIPQIAETTYQELMTALDRLGGAGFKRWMTSDGISAIPYIDGWSRDFTSMAFGKAISDLNRKVFSSSRFTMQKAESSMWYAENEVRTVTAMMTPTMCG